MKQNTYITAFNKFIQFEGLQLDENGFNRWLTRKFRIRLFVANCSRLLEFSTGLKLLLRYRNKLENSCDRPTVTPKRTGVIFNELISIQQCVQQRITDDAGANKMDKIKKAEGRSKFIIPYKTDGNTQTPPFRLKLYGLSKPVQELYDNELHIQHKNIWCKREYLKHYVQKKCHTLKYKAAVLRCGSPRKHVHRTFGQNAQKLKSASKLVYQLTCRMTSITMMLMKR